MGGGLTVVIAQQRRAIPELSKNSGLHIGLAPSDPGLLTSRHSISFMSIAHHSSLPFYLKVSLWLSPVWAC